MPFLKTACAPVVKPELDKGEWRHKKSDILCSGGICLLGDRRVKTAERAIQSYNPKSFLLSHVSIMASVDVEASDRSDVTFQDYKISPETAQFMNNNGDSWEKKLLLATFPTFVGAENYVEHVQNPLLSKGKVIDAVSREVPVLHPVDKTPMAYPDGKPVTTVYIDLLVATDRKYDQLAQSIVAGKTNALSMGCLLKFTICSECGKVIFRDDDACDHIKYNKGGFHVDEEGITRITTELCGHYTDPSSCEFIEASWVSIPAFRGAVRRNVLNMDEMKIASQLRSAYQESERRVPTIYRKKAASQMRTAQQRLEQLNAQVIPERIVQLMRNAT